MAAGKAYKRKITRQGLGSGERAVEPGVEPARPTLDEQPAEPAPTGAPRPRNTLPAPADPAPRAEVSSDSRPPLVSDAPPSGQISKPPSRRASRRPVVAVDEVGDISAGLHSRPPTAAKPRVVKSRADLASAPLGPREAFLLSLVDGKLNVGSLMDVSGMDEDEVSEILARLRRLGIIAYA
jgi:hypothetical protein